MGHLGCLEAPLASLTTGGARWVGCRQPSVVPDLYLFGFQSNNSVFLLILWLGGVVMLSSPVFMRTLFDLVGQRLAKLVSLTWPVRPPSVSGPQMRWLEQVGWLGRPWLFLSGVLYRKPVT